MSVRSEIVQFIRDQFRDNDNGVAVIGMSGGKDSTITAALCVEALGADRVIGVRMPCGVQKDGSVSVAVCRALRMPYGTINIGEACDELYGQLRDMTEKTGLPDIVTSNTPARLRMTSLYMVAGMYPGSRVVNTCNRSEDYVGYSTKYGDAAGDFSPLGNLTVREVLAIGQEYIDEGVLKREWVYKTPDDGMSGLSDEQKLGFTYDELDGYLLEGKYPSPEKCARISALHVSTRHKYKPMPIFNPNEEETV